jgi:acetolactate synthase-1/2/3 large subunit
VRDFTKWDDQPATIDSVPETVARAYRVAMSGPQGPVYVCLDAGLQEDELTGDVPALDMAAYGLPSRLGPDPAALEDLARRLVAAERPLFVTGYLGRDHHTFDELVELAELLGAGVIDSGNRLSFPNQHPLCVTGSDEVTRADLVCFLDVKDMGKPTQALDRTTRQIRSLIPADAQVCDLGFGDLSLSSWSHDFAQLHRTDLQVTADTGVALPLLLERCRALESEDTGRRDARAARRQELGRVHDAVWSAWGKEAEANADLSPVSTSRLAQEVWGVVKDHDWVLTAGTASGWAQKIWDFDRPYRHPGNSLGTATQISISLGVALHHKGSGKLVVDLQPDGDLMFDPGALWVAAYHKIPMLTVMFNNRAYYNDWEHQERIARQRGTPVENAYVGMEINGPAPDFAAIAQGFGWWSEGPIDDPSGVGDAVRRAAEQVQTTGMPALVDVVCQPE